MCVVVIQSLDKVVGSHCTFSGIILQSNWSNSNEHAIQSQPCHFHSHCVSTEPRKWV